MVIPIRPNSCLLANQCQLHRAAPCPCRIPVCLWNRLAARLLLRRRALKCFVLVSRARGEASFRKRGEHSRQALRCPLLSLLRAVPLEKDLANRLITRLFFKGGFMKFFFNHKMKTGFEHQLMAAFLLGLVLMTISPDVSAQTFTEACNKVTGFFAQFETILRVASVSIVTIAVVFAGYQIAFAHKRLSDVAPILVGGLLIGGAATIAGWFVGDWVPSEGAATTCGAQDA